MTDGSPIAVVFKPGVRRDGTTFDGEDYHVEAEWCRWHEGRPRKMGGFRAIYEDLTEIVRGINSHPADDNLFVHLGSAGVLLRLIFNVNSYVIAGVATRTPTGLTSSANNLWQFDQMYDASASFTAGTTRIVAHAAPNALDIASDTAAPVYTGDITDTAALTPVASSDVSGGVVSLFPYLLAYGSDGLVRQSVANKPMDLTGPGSNIARVTSKKIVKGLMLRGGAGNAPSGLLWSLDSIIRASFVGGGPVFSYDSMSNQNGILAANSVVEHDGVYYWVGLGRFMMFNGLVRELPNDLNSNFFFDNLNWPHRNKVFAFKVPRYGEIWWCFPKVPSTEPNWAVIKNLKADTWYDTELPNTGRSAAENAASYRFPLVAGVQATDSAYTLWQHETGVDEVAGVPVQTRAIRSYYRTPEFAVVPPQNRTVSSGMFEPDFVQTGSMTVRLIGRPNPRAEQTVGDPQTFIAGPTNTPAEQFVNFKRVNRLASLEFESNVAGGFYQAGKPLWHVQPDGARST